MTEEVKGKVPKIRFEGFEGEWEERKLGEMGAVKTGNTPLTNVSEYWSEEKTNYPWITPTDICATYTSETQKYLTELGHNVGRYVKKNSVLITSIASIGKNTINTVDAHFNQQINAIEANDKFDSHFLLNAMIRSSNRFEYMAGESATKIINKTQFENFEINVPNIEEQAQLGAFFFQLDKLIALYQEKLTLLEKQKQTFLQLMFPKPGSNIPEVRFAGFSEEWEAQRFSEITYPCRIKNKENLPLKSYSISNEFGFIAQDEQFENGGSMKLADKSVYYIVTPKSFAYNPARINVGSIGYQNLQEDVIVSSLYEIFKTVDKIDDNFLWYWFKTDIFQRIIEKSQEGGVRQYFFYKKLCAQSLWVPSLEEQAKIGAFFAALDSNITRHQEKLEQLKALKKTLLKEMFV